MTDYSPIIVRLSDGFDYPIVIKQALVDVFNSARFNELVSGKSVLVISDSTVADFYLEELMLLLGGADTYQLSSYVFEPGESSKILTTVSCIYDFMLEKRFDRHSVVIALGGGIVGDIAGFVSATFMRGIDFIQIPTTVLAQVDSSVGGKTGVNHPRGKNLIGAFKQPEAVLISTGVLKTLPDREVAAGLAEVIKYGLIYDSKFYLWLEENILSLNGLEPSALQHAIERSCSIKAEVVAEDEKERGLRAFLNFGHTFGHAVEQIMGYGKWLHGEAVAVGMLMAMTLSQQLGYVDNSEVSRLERLLIAAKLPTKIPAKLKVNDLIEAMQSDKKACSGQLVFVVLLKIGTAKIVKNLPLKMVEQSIVAHQEIV